MEFRATEKGFYNAHLYLAGETFEAHESFSGSWAERVEAEPEVAEAESEATESEPEAAEVEPEKPKRGRPKKQAEDAE